MKSTRKSNKSITAKPQIVATVMGIALTIVLIAGISWGIFYLTNEFAHKGPYNTPEAKQRFTTLEAEVTKWESNVMHPAGAVKDGRSEIRGSSDSDTAPCTIDVHCPTIAGVWLVPIDPNGEAQFLTSALQKVGYTITAGDLQSCAAQETSHHCNISAIKGQFSVDISTGIPNSSDKLPTNNISPKNWRYVSARFDYYWEAAK